MSRTVTGPLYHPSGDVITNTKLRIRALRHNYSADGGVPVYSDTELNISALGEFNTSLLPGDYEAYIQYGSSYQRLGIIIVDPAENATITLAELIELSRDRSADYSASGLVTYDQMVGYVGVGGSPADISLTAFKAEPAQAGKYVRQRVDGLGVEYHTLTPQDVIVAYEMAVNNQLLQTGHAYILPPGSTVVLPSVWNTGDWIQLMPGGDLEATPATLNMNNNKLKGSSDTSVTYDIKVGLTLVYIDASYGIGF